ncbi:MAG: arylsulfatase, partial [Alloprevotella sp.]
KGQALDSQPHLCNLLGGDASPRPYVIEQSLSHTLSVRTATWKYIEPSEGREFMQLEKVETGNAPLPQLYDMTDDSGERTNVAEKHPQVVYELQNILRKERNRRK